MRMQILGVDRLQATQPTDGSERSEQRSLHRSRRAGKPDHIAELLSEQRELERTGKTLGVGPAVMGQPEDRGDHRLEPGLLLLRSVDLDENTRIPLAGIPPVVGDARQSRCLLADLEHSLHPVQARPEGPRQYGEPLRDAGMRVLSGNRTPWLDGQVRERALSRSCVLVASEDHDPLAADAILVEVTEARHPVPWRPRPAQSKSATE